MAKKTIDLEHMSIADLLALQESVDRQLAATWQREKEALRASFEAEARKRGFNKKEIADLFKSQKKVAPKYADPKTGETWTGRGRMPRWLTARVANGQDREQFRI